MKRFQRGGEKESRSAKLYSIAVRPERRKPSTLRRAVFGLAALAGSILATDTAREAYQFQEVVQPAEAETIVIKGKLTTKENPPKEIRFLNWNVAGGKNPQGNSNLETVKQQLSVPLKPQVVVFTEFMKKDVPKIQSELDGYWMMFDTAETRPNIELSRHGLLSTEPLTKGTFVAIAPELVGEEFNVNTQQLGRPTNNFAARSVAHISTSYLRLAVTHLEATNQIVREAQAEQVVRMITAFDNQKLPLFKVGDYNAGRDSETLNILMESAPEGNAVECGQTHEDYPGKQIDWIVLPDSVDGTCQTVSTGQSDHRAMFVVASL